MQSEAPSRDNIDPVELRRRVLYALFAPAAKIAAGFGVPLAEMKRLVETAYYHEAKRRNLSMSEAMEMMGISISKAALLSRQLKNNFMAPDLEYALPRRIEYMLWAGPMTFSRINQALPAVDAVEVQSAVEALLADGCIRVVASRAREDVFKLITRQSRRVWSTWLARLDGLHNALDSVTDAVRGRFFQPDRPAFARTVTFHASKEDLGRLETFYEESLFPLLAELDGATEELESAEIEKVSLSLFWSAHETSCPNPPEDEP